MFTFLEETLVKEKIWALISQNEPSVVPISMVITQLKIVNSITQVLFYISEMMLCRLQSYQLRIAWHVLICLKCFLWNICNGKFHYNAKKITVVFSFMCCMLDYVLFSWFCSTLSNFSVRLMLQVKHFAFLSDSHIDFLN